VPLKKPPVKNGATKTGLLPLPKMGADTLKLKPDTSKLKTDTLKRIKLKPDSVKAKP
jgi:hypothetical protein